MKGIKSLRFGLKVVCFLLMFTCLFCKNCFAGENLSEAQFIQTDTTISGTLELNQESYYKFVLPQNSLIKIDVKTEGHNQHFSGWLLDSSGNEIDNSNFSSNDDNNWGYQSATKYYSLSTGTYYIETKNTSSSYGDTEGFEICVSVLNKSKGNIVVAGLENRYLSKAVNFTIGNTLTGVADPKSLLYNAIPCHYYCFSLQEKCNVKLEITVPTWNGIDTVNFYLVDGNGKHISGDYVNISGKEEKGVIQDTLTAGTYYIEVSRASSGNIPYTIKTSASTIATNIKVGKVKIISAKAAGNKKIKIKWEKTKCSGYQIQYSTGKKFSSGVSMKNVSAGKKNYTIGGLKKGKYYYVRMRAYYNYNGKTYYGKWSSVKKVKTK